MPGDTSFRNMGIRFTLSGLLTMFFFAGSSFALEPSDIYRQKSPSVVLIFAKVDERTQKGGSGFFIADRGLVVTNAHVITADDGKALGEITVYLKPPRVSGDFQADLKNHHRAHMMKYDRALDIALLEVEGMAVPVEPLSFADSDNVEVGQRVVAIGHPEQGGLWTLTTGTISTRVKNISNVQGKDMFQSDASINHGNSGGPLMDAEGNVVGMNSSTVRKSSDGTAIVGINFALQSNVIVNWLKKNSITVTAAIPAAVSQASPPPSRETTKAAAPMKAKEPAEAAKVESAKEKRVEQIAPKQEEKAPAQGKIETPAKPFKWDDLEATISEMKDLMQEMRGKVRQKFGE